LDLEDGFAAVRAGVVERGALPELPVVRALGRRRRRHRQLALSTACVAVLAVLGLAGWSVPQLKHTLAASSIGAAAVLKLDATVQLEQVVPVDTRITYALAASSVEKSWVLAVTRTGGLDWTGYVVPALAYPAAAQMRVITPTTVRISQATTGSDVLSKDMGRSWRPVSQAPGRAVRQLPADWSVGPGIHADGLTMVDPLTGVEHPFEYAHASGPPSGYQAIAATDGSLWGFGPFGARTAGNPATAWVSRDRGRSWRDFTPRPDTPMRTGAIATYDGSVGYLAVDASDDPVDGSKLYTTRDFGQHWTYVSSTDEALTGLMLLPDNRTLLGLLGNGEQPVGGRTVQVGTLVSSINGGRTFAKVAQAALVPGALSDLTTTAGGGYALTVSGADPQALFSPDGRTWAAAPLPPIRR
jgi:hypothetical protein